MFKNNLKIAWRNIRKNRGFSILNIVGLTIGLTCFLLLGIYIIHETHYDRFLPNANRVGYVSMAYKSAEDSEFTYSGSTPTAVAPMLKKEFAEVEKTVRLYDYNQEGIVRKGNRYIKERHLEFADEDFFEVLPYPFLAGNPKTALQQPYQIVLTQELAEKYFPNVATPIGHTLEIDGQPWEVSGVISNPPSYTEVSFGAILSNKHLSRYHEPVWDSANDITFVLVHSKKDIAVIERKANAFIQKKFSDIAKNGAEFKIHIEPLTNVHLHSKAGTGNILYVYIFGILALSILVISCVNFTNLSLARSTERIKEIGIKKVLGATRPSLFFSFLVECAMIVGIALFLAIGFAYILLPFFSDYIGSSITFNLQSTTIFYVVIFVLAILVSILAGSGPALAISAFKPTQTLKGKIGSHKSKLRTGNALIIFQFIVSTLFIIGTLITTRQLHFLQTKNTNLKRSQIVVLDGSVLSDADRTTLKQQLLTRSSILGVTASYDSPINIQGGYAIYDVEGKNASYELNVTAIPVEKDFLPVFEIPILVGSPITEGDVLQAKDTTGTREYAFIVNQKLVSALQWTPKEAIGKSITLSGRKGHIKTVVEDFNFASLKEKIKPVVLFPDYSYFGNIFVKVKPQSGMQASLANIQTVWKSIKPNVPFDYHFLDDEYAALYRLERQTSKTMFLFSIITIGIACMGLFALAAFQAQKRLKEMGIRKVLGASVSRIVVLLSTDFIKMVGIAFLVAVPIGRWIMHKWLDNFAYRIEIKWWVFITVGIFSLGITFITVGSQAFRTATANPIDSLRDE